MFRDERVLSAELRAQLPKERANARELNHNSTTSGTDVSDLYELKTAENLKQAGEIKRASLSGQNQTPTEPPYPLLVNTRSRPDACPERVLLLAIAQSVSRLQQALLSLVLVNRPKR